MGEEQEEDVQEKGMLGWNELCHAVVESMDHRSPLLFGPCMWSCEWWVLLGLVLAQSPRYWALCLRGARMPRVESIPVKRYTRRPGGGFSCGRPLALQTPKPTPTGSSSSFASNMGPTTT